MFTDISEDVLMYHILPWRRELSLFELEQKKTKTKNILEGLAHEEPTIGYVLDTRRGYVQYQEYATTLTYDDDIKRIYIYEIPHSSYLKITTNKPEYLFYIDSKRFVQMMQDFQYNMFLDLVKSHKNQFYVHLKELL